MAPVAFKTTVFGILVGVRTFVQMILQDCFLEEPIKEQPYLY